jgi:hypothetical protein
MSFWMRRIEMAHSVYIDRSDAGEIVVSWYSGASALKSKTFAGGDRGAAEAFAEGKMNKRNGMMISTLDMSAEQLAAHRKREATLRAMAVEMQKARDARLRAELEPPPARSDDFEGWNQ